MLRVPCVSGSSASQLELTPALVFAHPRWSPEHLQNLHPANATQTPSQHGTGDGVNSEDCGSVYIHGQEGKAGNLDRQRRSIAKAQSFMCLIFPTASNISMMLKLHLIVPLMS